VKKGDNLTKIAAEHGMSVKELKKLNEMTSDNVVEGKVLRVK
jgi:LysM repeat protein